MTCKENDTRKFHFINPFFFFFFDIDITWYAYNILSLTEYFSVYQ